jgi:hypothetical protein
MHILTLQTSRLVTKDEGLDELVGLVLGVAVLDGLDRVIGLGALALDESIDGHLDAVPALVTVHGVVAANKSDELANANLLDSLKELLDVLVGRLGSSVAAVAEGVDVDVLDALLLGGTEEGEEVGDVRVNTAVREESHGVQAATVLLRALQALDNGRLVLELVLLDRLVDTDNVLPDDAARSNVQVADLGVAHETLLQTNSEARGLKLSKVVLVTNLVHVGGLAVEDGIALLVVGKSPAIVDAARVSALR